MRIGLLDSGYRNPELLGLGLSWLKWELQQHGVETIAPADADIVLASVQSQQAVRDLRRELKRQNVDPATRPVIIGGPGGYAPAIYDNIITAACVGEGRRFVAQLLSGGIDGICDLPEAWIPGETRTVQPNEEFPWDCPPIRYQDGTTRLFASRGCRRKCLFCQTGWESAYRQNPDMDSIYRQAHILHQRGDTVFCTSNDQSELDWKRLPPLPHMSASVHGLRRFVLQPHVLQRVRSIRVGVEGVSERLRKAVRKPIAWQELLDTTVTVLDSGRTFRWFMIAGLPGETDADYEELRDAVLYLKRHCKKGAVMMHFHAFIPHPAAPLSCLPLVDDYWERFDEFRRWFFDGPGSTRRVQIMPCAKPPTRLRQAMESMAATEAELRRGWFEHDNPNWRVQYVCDTGKRRALAWQYVADLQPQEAAHAAGCSPPTQTRAAPPS